MKTYRPKMRGNLCFVELCASLIVLQDKEQCVLIVCIKWNRTAGSSNCSHFVCFLCFMFPCCSQVLCFRFTCVLLPSWKCRLFSFCLLFCVSCSHVALESCAQVHQCAAAWLHFAHLLGWCSCCQSARWLVWLEAGGSLWTSFPLAFQPSACSSHWTRKQQ